MAKKGFWERFIEWQNYVHYILLALLVMIFHGVIFSSGWFLNFLRLSAFLLVADSIIHGIFWLLPKPYRWRD